MSLLLEHLFPSLIAAFALGAVTGWKAARSPRAQPVSKREALAVALLLAAGLAIALLGLAPGRAGLFLEIALLLLAAFVPAMALGALAARRRKAV